MIQQLCEANSQHICWMKAKSVLNRYAVSVCQRVHTAPTTLYTDNQDLPLQTFVVRCCFFSSHKHKNITVCFCSKQTHYCWIFIHQHVPIIIIYEYNSNHQGLEFLLHTTLNIHPTWACAVLCCAFCCFYSQNNFNINLTIRTWDQTQHINKPICLRACCTVDLLKSSKLFR